MIAAVVVCPGRGTYNAGELGYLARHHAARADFLAQVDALRASRGEAKVSELDGARAFDPQVHARGDNASPLIFTCSYADFLAIDRSRFDILAVTGNSMGWYTGLACAGALAPTAALGLVDTMGGLMQTASVGGQAIWSLVDEDWREIPGRRAELAAARDAVHGHDSAELYDSIELGGMLVMAGDRRGLEGMTRAAPRGPGRFPLTLAGHAGFHSPLQALVSEQARQLVDAAAFRQPRIPLIDGAGRIWRPHASDRAALWDYTIGEQVTHTYDFTRAVQVAVKEFAPAAVIVLGPGETLGGAVAQSLVAIGWRGLRSKADFQALQAAEPYVLAMGRADQRGRVAV